MTAFANIKGIPGEATDSAHKDWIILESLSAPIYRSIPEGAKDQQRSRGSTTLGDIVIVRQLDKSSVKLQEACANGTYYSEIEVHLCTQVGNKQEPYLKYKLKNAIVSSYSFHGNSSGQPVPTEQVTFNFTEIDWTYIVVDPKDGSVKGNVAAKFNPGEHKA